jgi:hypothetical protein
MLLAEFVAAKLKQIIQGVRAAQENSIEAETSLNPQTAAPKEEAATSSGEWYKRFESLSLPVETIHRTYPQGTACFSWQGNAGAEYNSAFDIVERMCYNGFGASCRCCQFVWLVFDIRLG